MRAVEVFQPVFRPGSPTLDIRGGMDELVSDVRDIRDRCDVVLVGDHKDPRLLKFSSIQTAALLEGEAGVKAAPVIVARDSNRAQTLSAIVTAYGLGLTNLMLAWGDRYPAGGPANVYDFPSLSAVIAEARTIAESAGLKVRLFAPVDLRTLGSPGGIRVARSRLRAGADLLLAQPPTTDSEGVLDAHADLVRAARLKESVLLGVFPFRSEHDLVSCEGFFGWSLPRSLHKLAGRGEDALIAEARRVSAKLRSRGFVGVYLSTRGTPRIARRLLG
jgi:5,10-methylenetetrahydrofolate reductase